ncbi:unnamed protein product [Chrysoparadoxa australica]
MGILLPPIPELSFTDVLASACIISLAAATTTFLLCLLTYRLVSKLTLLCILVASIGSGCLLQEELAAHSMVSPDEVSSWVAAYASLLVLLVGSAVALWKMVLLLYPKAKVPSLGHRLSGVGIAHPSMSDVAYLDYNGTTPVYPEVMHEMLPCLSDCFGNPSSSHAYGTPAKQSVDNARGRLARLLGCPSKCITFTGCGSESDNWAIAGAVELGRASLPGKSKPHVITSAIEHPAVLAFLRRMEERDQVTATYVPVTQEGIVNMQVLEGAFQRTTVLVSVMHSNNEVGSLQPVAEIAALCRKRGVLFHTDAAQSIGKVPVDVNTLDADMITVVGHKIGAPKGIAALYIREGLALPSLLCGGGQEHGRRAGTENVVGIVGMGCAAKIAGEELTATAEHMRAMKDLLRGLLTAGFGSANLKLNGPADQSLVLPNTLSISFQGISAVALLNSVSEHVAASAGSACHSSGAGQLSPVLKAMGVQQEVGLGTIRFSVGRHTTAAEVETAAKALLRAARQLKDETKPL